jgi:hypothetical protein
MCTQNLTFKCSKQHFFSKSWPLFDFFTFVVHFMLDLEYPVPDPEAELECLPVTVPLRQKVAVSSVPVPQHWREVS